MTSLALETGQIVDREYKVERLLSQGGMGAVYIAEHITTGKRRALKVMLPHLVRDQASRDRFEREARIGARIESDNVVEVVDAGVDEATGLPFLAMELLDGVDLDHVLTSHGVIPPRGVADIVGQLCDALGRGHAIGVVHSDLKPENVFLEKPRRRGVAFTVKVMDYGIAKLASDEHHAARVTTPIGSPLWMAPEQTQRGAPITPGTDVWALGLMVYRMLTGRSYWRIANAPDGKTNLGALVLEVVVQPLVPASQRAQEQNVSALLPAGFDAWFARCVVREAEQRYTDAAQAWDGLEPLLGGASVTSTGPVSLVPGVLHVPTQGAPMPAQGAAPVQPVVHSQPVPYAQPVVHSQPVMPAQPMMRAPTQAAAMPFAATAPQQAPAQPAAAWSQPVAQPAVQWPAIQQRVWAWVPPGVPQLATVLEVDTQRAAIRVRLDAGGDGWLPASHLRAL